LKFASVCSGIEAASVAFEPLGFTPQWFSEIEPFPCEVLKYQFPTVPNLGDMTKLTTNETFRASSVDLLVGGTPCQSFSVAGLRGGLADPRGNLMLTFLSLADAKKPRWIVWENVPGVLSSNGGRDFGTFLQGLAECGYGFAYRVLDAQFFGVAQRRRRVFVVGHFGDWRPAAAVLFESESLQRDTKPSRKKRQETPTDAQGGVGTTSFAGNVESEVAACLQTTYDDYSRADGFNTVVEPVAQPISWDSEVNCNINKMGTIVRGGQGGRTDGVAQPIAVQGNLIGRTKGGPQGIGVSQDGSMYTLTKTDVHGVAQPIAVDTPTIIDRLEQTSVGALCARDYKGVGNQYVDEGKCITSPVTMAIRRLTPKECERLQGFPDDWTRIPYRNKPADQCPDGPRYKACGNSMAVPVMRWIGQRIQLIDTIIN